MSSSDFQRLLGDAKNIPIEQEAERLGVRLSGKKYRSGPCPVCGGRDRFSINTIKQLFFCRQCDVGGDVIRLVEHVQGLDFRDAVMLLAGGDRPVGVGVGVGVGVVAPEKPLDVLGLWRGMLPATGTLVEKYLRHRGLSVAVPPTLRFAPRLWHAESGLKWPAMVGLVTHGVSGEAMGLHRTFLAEPGRKAPVEPVKKMLGRVYQGAVRFAPPSETLGVGEGIETCLAVLQEAGMGVWAALSTSGLRNLELPGMVKNVVIFADNDEPGLEAANDAGCRWVSEGRRVKIAKPNDAKDFADLVRIDK